MKDKCHSESPLIRFCEAKRRGRRIRPTETSVHKPVCNNNPETIKNQAQNVAAITEKVWILWLHCETISVTISDNTPQFVFP
jgi:hypothetical protein